MGWGQESDRNASRMANERARRLRAEQTDAERRLWRELRGLKSDGFHFRRQAPIGRYIVDFACHTARLAIEVDGGQHGMVDMAERDDARTEWLAGRGFRVLRFWNDEVLGNIDGVMRVVADALATPPPTPPRKRGGE